MGEAETLKTKLQNRYKQMHELRVQEDTVLPAASSDADPVLRLLPDVPNIIAPVDVRAGPVSLFLPEPVHKPSLGMQLLPEDIAGCLASVDASASSSAANSDFPLLSTDDFYRLLQGKDLEQLLILDVRPRDEYRVRALGFHQPSSSPLLYRLFPSKTRQDRIEVFSMFLIQSPLTSGGVFLCFFC